MASSHYVGPTFVDRHHMWRHRFTDTSSYPNSGPVAPICRQIACGRYHDGGTGALVLQRVDTTIRHGMDPHPERWTLSAGILSG